MNKDFKNIIHKCSLFLIPILVWIAVLTIVDPFNYFSSNSFISEISKEKTAKKFNSLLYNTLSFKNNPTQNIIIGDSRIKRLPVDNIKKISGDDYFILHSNAAKLNEMIDLFWFTNKYSKLKNVIIGINFNLYNEFAYANRVNEIVEMTKNPLLYIFNGNVLEITFKTIIHHFSNVAVPNIKRNIMLKKELNGKSYKDKKVWWDYNIKTVAKNQYSKYKYPKKIKERLKEVNNYCEDNDINLIFLNVPHNVEFSARKKDYNLTEAEKKYKKDISKFGTVIDYDFPNQITNCKQCFTDPIHTNDSISLIMAKEIFTDSLKIGKKL